MVASSYDVQQFEITSLSDTYLITLVIKIYSKNVLAVVNLINYAQAPPPTPTSTTIYNKARINNRPWKL